MHAKNFECIPSVEMDGKPKKNIRQAIISIMGMLRRHVKRRVCLCLTLILFAKKISFQEKTYKVGKTLIAMLRNDGRPS
jgi:hypothetical protein